MISPSYFVSANHLAPGGGAQITFHLDNSPTGATYVGTVDGTWSYRGNVGGLPSDLYVGRLTTPIPAGVGVATYPILSLPNPLTDYHNAELWVYGFKNYSNILSDAVGRNLVNNPSGYADMELSYTNTSHTEATALLIYNYDTFVPYYTSQILTAIQASNRPESVTVIVPEPGALLLLLLGCGYWGTRRRGLNEESGKALRSRL